LGLFAIPLGTWNIVRDVNQSLGHVSSPYLRAAHLLEWIDAHAPAGTPNRALFAVCENDGKSWAPFTHGAAYHEIREDDDTAVVEALFRAFHPSYLIVGTTWGGTCISDKGSEPFKKAFSPVTVIDGFEIYRWNGGASRVSGDTQP
jgi:hypothetical protein